MARIYSLRTTLIVLFCIVVTPITTTYAAPSWCQPNVAPRITIKPSTDNISYNYTLSEKQLNSFSIDTKNPYGGNVITDVGGLMKGGIQTEQKMTFGTMANRNTREVCYWYNTIDVKIHISPTIYIANKFPKGSCMFNAIMQHEEKHVIVDREIVNKYAIIIGKALKDEIAAARIYGPVADTKESLLGDKMRGRMKQILDTTTRQMSAERQKRQQEVDSLKEYERVNHQCKQ